jgi:hypothetical protein
LEDRNLAATPPPCVNYIGIVPYATLGLDRSAVLDGWDNYITYVLSPPQPTLPALPIPSAPQPPWTTSWTLTYVQAVTLPTLQTTVGSLAFWPTVSTGAITVNDVTGTAISNPAATPPTGAVLVLISYGRNGYGATNVNGSVNSTAGAGQDELSNANPAALGPTQFLVVNRDITDQIVVNHGSFDDIVLPLRQNDLVAPLAVNGTIQPSALPALNQANDYVAALIVGSAPGRVACPAAVAPCAACSGFFYNMPPTTVVTPGTVPITYTPAVGANNICSNAPAAATAYTLQSPDQSIKTVTYGEAIGILGRVGGFN